MILLQTASLLLALAAEPGQVVDRVAATVNGEPVTLAEVEDRAGGDPVRAGADKARWKALRTALDQIIDEKLFEAQAAALQVDVGDAQVDSAVEDIKRRNHFDDAQLKEAIAQQGMTLEAFRKMVKRNLEAFEILRSKVSSRVRITDEDLKTYYQNHAKEYVADDEVRVRHIFLALPKGASAAEQARIQATGERVLQRIKAGEDFGKIAKEVSQGPSAKEGGELGFLKRGTVQPELERAAFALSAGEISGLIRTKPGFQILQVEERRGGAQRPFGEVKDEIRDRLTNEQLETYRSEYIADLRKDAVIDIKIPELQ
jgi:peptidyl-prolyl cis-trans isomerase SurA